jgi:hypothetical protein
MKTIIRIKVLVAVASSLIFLTCAQAQDIIVNNLPPDAPVDGNDAISSVSSKGNSFTMDGTSRSLQSVTLSLGKAADGTIGTFQVELRNDNSSTPGTVIATLTGESNPLPLTATTYSYTPSSEVTLSAGTKYWVVAEATTTSGSYTWNWTSSPFSSGAAGTLGGFSESLNGGPWSGEDPVGPFLFGVTAAVPEPSSYAAVFGILALGFGVASRRLRRG